MTAVYVLAHLLSSRSSSRSSAMRTRADSVLPVRFDSALSRSRWGRLIIMWNRTHSCTSLMGQLCVTVTHV